MKNRILSLCAVLFIGGCAGYQPKTQLGKNLQAWWSNPDTQQHVATVARNVTVAIMAGGAESLREYVTTGAVDPWKVGSIAAASVLFSNASALRTLQGTNQVLDPVATAQVLIASGTPKEAAGKLANQIVDKTALLVQAGMPVDQAAEVTAAALDKEAVNQQASATVEVTK